MFTLTRRENAAPVAAPADTVDSDQIRLDRTDNPAFRGVDDDHGAVIRSVQAKMRTA
jgi:hypothetical protein